MSNFSHRDSKSPTPASPTTTQLQSFPEKQEEDAYRPSTPQRAQHHPSNIRESPQLRERVEGNRVSSRPMSMVQTYQPPLMELTQDTLPELQPIFTYLNSHGNKLYQEGYFLKLDDQNSRTSCRRDSHKESADGVQMENQMRIGRGRSASRSLLALSCLSGMQQSLMLLEQKGKYSPNS